MIEMLKRTVLVVVVLFFSSLANAYSDLPGSMYAWQIKTGCDINFIKEEYLREPGETSNPLYDVLMKWDCKNSGSVLIDTYYVEGISPEIITVLFWKKRSIAVLVKWAVHSHASDFYGDFYRVYVYRYVPSKSGAEFRKEESVMKNFGEGWDGEWNGVPVQYRFKDAASIRKRLGEINYLR